MNEKTSPLDDRTFSRRHVRKLASLTLLHGLCLFVITYILVYLVHGLTSVSLATAASKNPVLFHNKVLFITTTGWNLYDAISIYGSPILIMAILSGFLFQAFKRTNDKYLLQKPFVFWLLLHSFNRFAGCVLPGMVSNESFKYMADWLYIGPYGLFVFVVASLIATVLVGGFFTKMALQSAVYAQSIKSNYRLKYLNQALLYPWLIGTAILTCIQWPHIRSSTHEIATLLMMAFLIFPMYYYLKFLNKKPVSRRKPLYENEPINLKLVAYAAIILTAFRLGLGNGLYF